ncbi:dTDP-4-oxo-6-deoxy-D-allose reductase [bacterium BMS3Abin15]|nr:dTDP-4-oxo-6-deoxy-D-allose reductase [bacterium BMS3Abin15]
MGQIVITGGAGFIGFHLARYHAELGDKVILLDNFFKSEGKRDDELDALLSNDNVQIFQVDLKKPIPDIEVSGSIDIVYHLAAINGTRLFYEIPYEVCRDNLLLTLNLLNWLENYETGRILYSSSSEVYAGADKFDLLKIPTDEHAPVIFPQPTDVRFSYGTSKFMGEFLCIHFGKKFNVPTSVIRYHNIFGPRMGSKHVIPEFALRLKERENPFRIYGGNETRAFCYIDDAVKATHMVASETKCAYEIVHIGNSKEEITINDLAVLMMEIFGDRFELEEHGGRSSSVSRRCPDTSKLKKLTGFEAQVDLREGLTRTMDWYLNQFKDQE